MIKTTIQLINHLNQKLTRMD